MSRFFLIIVFFFPLAMPSFAFAQGLVPCGTIAADKGAQTKAENDIKTVIAENAKKEPKDRVAIPEMVFEGEITNPCGFGDIITISSSVINWLIGIGIMVATLGFAYAGLLYITAAGSEEKIKHAHSIFVKVLIGFTLMLGAWLIAKAFETVFLNEAAKARSFLAN